METIRPKKKDSRAYRQSGFTLIELLVVISIIGILSTVAVTSLNGARAKARDARRTSDLGQISLALQQYHIDHDSWYVEGYGWNDVGRGWFNYYNGVPGSYEKSIAQGLTDAGYPMNGIIDPLVPADQQSVGTHHDYKITACLNMYWEECFCVYADMETRSSMTKDEASAYFASIGCIDTSSEFMNYAIKVPLK